MTSLLRVENVTVRFGSNTVLRDVSLQVDPGETVGLVGPNGAGKTTLFRVIAGELIPNEGSVFLNERSLPPRADARSRSGIGRTFQAVQIFDGLTVMDHVLVSLQGHNGTAGPLRDLRAAGKARPGELFRCRQILALCGLARRADDYAASLSLGERRAVELARALVGEPSVLLTDEPSSGLDTDETNALIALFRRVQSETGLALVLVEHDFSTVRSLSTRIVALNAGEKVAEGSFEDVMSTPAVRTSWLGEPL